MRNQSDLHGNTQAKFSFSNAMTLSDDTKIRDRSHEIINLDHKG